MPRAPADPARSRAESRAAVVILVAAVVVVFAPTLFGEFVFDDHRFIVENPNVRAPASWLRLLTDAGTADPTFPHGIVRPLRTFEFALDHALFGLSPSAFHLHSLLWHVLATTLAYAVMRRLLGDARAAFAAALIWAVHPVQVESVAWISSRGDVAMGACSLAAVLFALRSEGFDRALVVSLAAAAVAPLYKETAVVLPIVVAVLRWTGRTRAPVWPYVVVAGAYLVYRSSVLVGGMDVSFVLGGSVAGTFSTMIRAFGFYLVEPLLPAQSLDWYITPSTSFADAAVVLWLVVHAALLSSAVVARTRAPRWTLAVACFYAFLLPVANWPFFTGVPTTERFLYLPLLGVALALGCALVRAPRAAFAAAFVAAAALGGASIARAALWRDDHAMRRAVLADHESPRFRALAGQVAQDEALALRGRAFGMSAGPELDETVRRVKSLLEQALDDEHRALDQWYAFEMTSHSRGYVAMRAEFIASNVCYLLNRPEEALFHAEEALRIRDDVLPEPHYDRAWPLLKLGFAPQAMQSMRRARALGSLEPRADVGALFLEAAEACERDGLHEEAEAGYVTAVDACPEGPMRDAARQKLAACRSRTRSPGDAETERAKLAELDERLEAYPRSCPVRRDHAIRK